MTQRNGQQFHS